MEPFLCEPTLFLIRLFAPARRPDQGQEFRALRSGPGSFPMGPWVHGSLGPWVRARVLPHGPLGPWVPGPLGPSPWAHGSMGPWVHGSMGPWVHWAHNCCLANIILLSLHKIIISRRYEALRSSRRGYQYQFFMPNPILALSEPESAKNALN